MFQYFYILPPIASGSSESSGAGNSSNCGIGSGRLAVVVLLSFSQPIL